MNGRAWIDNRRNVGYVVCWLENRVNKPLRNFGEMQSAAIEFRNYINSCTDERLQQWLKAWASTYNPDKKYTYPDFMKDGRVTLHQQRNN